MSCCADKTRRHFDGYLIVCFSCSLEGPNRCYRQTEGAQLSGCHLDMGVRPLANRQHKLVITRPPKERGRLTGRQLADRTWLTSLAATRPKSPICLAVNKAWTTGYPAISRLRSSVRLVTTGRSEATDHLVVSRPRTPDRPAVTWPRTTDCLASHILREMFPKYC